MKKFISGIMAGIILALCVSVFAQNAEIIIEKLPLKYIFNGVEKVPAEGEEGFIYNDRTYVPIRFVSESLNKNVEWNGDTYTVSISDKSSELIVEKGNLVIQDKQEVDFNDFKWYQSILNDMGASEDNCTMNALGIHKNYVIIEAEADFENEEDSIINLYRCELDGEEIELIANTQMYVCSFNYAIDGKYCIYNKLDEDNKKYLEVKDIETLEVTANLHNSYDEHVWEGSVFYISAEEDGFELKIMSLKDGVVKTIKRLPANGDFKIYNYGNYSHFICTDEENTHIYYYGLERNITG